MATKGIKVVWFILAAMAAIMTWVIGYELGVPLEGVSGIILIVISAAFIGLAAYIAFSSAVETAAEGYYAGLKGEKPKAWRVVLSIIFMLALSVYLIAAGPILMKIIGIILLLAAIFSLVFQLRPKKKK